MIERLWASFLSGLRPSFGIDDTARSLTLTFGLLAGLFKFLVALTVIWAMAAGVLQTARLIAYIPQGFPGNAKGVWVNQADWLAPIVAIFVYTLKAFGATTLVGLAAALIDRTSARRRALTFAGAHFVHIDLQAAFGAV